MFETPGAAKMRSLESCEAGVLWKTRQAELKKINQGQ